jgi:acyl-CoA thioester hydrolase
MTVMADGGHGVVVPVGLRWADMDVYGHVNNTEFLRVLEQARVDGLPLVRDPATTGFLVVRHEIEYLRPVEYRRDGVLVRMWCTGTRGAGFELGYEILDEGAVAARAESTLAAFDFRTSRPRRLSDAERSTLAGMTGPPVAFRRRR